MLRWGETGGSISGRVGRGSGGKGDGTAGEDRGSGPNLRTGAAGQHKRETGSGDRGRTVRGLPAVRLAVGIEEGKRRVTVDGRRPENAAGYLGVLKVASFSPEDLFLVKEYPSHRRRFLDRSIFHLYPGYLGLANEYRRALGQLNAALKTGKTGLIESWEDVLAPLAAAISVKRREQTAMLADRAAVVFGGILGGGELGAAYRSAVSGDTLEELTEAYRARLAARRAEGIKRGHCSVGPHTEDLTLLISGRDIRTAASRGQSRLALMALVLADCGLYNDERGEYPVLLLDDVGSELDPDRRDALMAHVSGMGQAVLTSTGRELTCRTGGRCFMVGADGVREQA